MDFSLNQEQTILKDSARRFLERECPQDFVREMMKDEKCYSPYLWKKMAELGWLGLIFEERYGGFGATFLDLAIILEEMGRVLLPGPFFSTVILSGLTIMQDDNEELKQRFLPAIANGDIIMTLALVEIEGSFSIKELETIAELRRDAFVLTGKKMFVSYAHIADYIICPARPYQRDHSDGISLFLLDTKSRGIGIALLKTIHREGHCEVRFREVHTPKSSIIGEKGQGLTYILGLWPKAVVGKCCEILGAMERVFEMTLRYVQERRQFGAPLSAFQVIQHYCADMAIELESSRFITHQAAWNVSKDLPSSKEAAIAKAWCSGTFKRMVATAHQIHGGIGFTEEHDLHLFFRSAKAWELTLGDANFHKEVVAKEIGL